MADPVQEGAASKGETVASRLSKDEAIKQAAVGIGLKKYNLSQAIPTHVTCTANILPFLGERLAGQKTWRIEFPNVDLGKASGRARLKNQHIRTIIVFLAPETGYVMRVVSIWPKCEERIATYPSRLQEERRMKDRSTMYDSVPKNPPKAALLDLLLTADRWSSSVKQIFACYVVESTVQHQKKPVWDVQLRGITPFSPLGGGGDIVVPEDLRNHFRSVFDAKTGDWLGAGTLPQPYLQLKADAKIKLLEDRH